jgi:phospholipid transport system substrate-binding protein
MPVSRRPILLSAVLSAGFAALPAALTRHGALAADSGAGAPAAIQRFYDSLLAVMKEAKHLSFDQRYQRLAPAVGQTFNLPLMTRLSVGPDWAKLPPAQQQALTDVFSRYTISVYANRFDDYNGERFTVDPAPAANPNGTLVQSSLVKSDGEKVLLNYLMRPGEGGAWQVIDVYLSGTISELATRRSEFVGVLQSQGADGLVRLLEQRAAALRTG